MKLFKKKKQLNNGGFSLVEVLVTMLVITIVSVPIINSFVSSARINKKSRNLQNATDVAQNYAEIFGSEDLDKLLNKYSGALDDDGFGNVVYTFEDIKETGASGEEFSLNIKLKSNASDVYDVPGLKNFFGESAAVCVREITRYDNAALNESHLNRTDKSGVEKTCDFYLDTKCNGEYSYNVKVTYRYGDNTFATDTMVLKEGKVAQEEPFPPLYILYEPYNIVNYKIQDYVRVNYTNDDNAMVKPMKVYLIPQAESMASSPVKPTFDLGRFWCNYSYDDVNSKLDFESYDVNNNTLTNGTKKCRIYDISIEVKYKDKIAARVSSLREDVQ